MSKATRFEYSPAVRQHTPDADESRLETRIRMKNKMRAEVAEAARDHAEGKISKEKHDRKIRQAHYELSDDEF
jgi:hypothetical protein